MGKLLVGLFVAGKLGKLLLSGGSMLVSVFAYSLVFGWRYAVGFVLLIFCHEMGHFVAARQRGLDVGLPTFIPFVGAWIELKQLPHNVETEAYVGIAGPVAGAAASMLCYFAARQTDSSLLLALCQAGCILNLFNLIPLSPFDGGRITAILSPKIWLLGAPLLVGLFLWRPSPMLIMVGILAYPQLKKAIWGDPKLPQGYHDVAMETRVNYGAMYIGLVAFLATMSYSLHETLAGRG